MGYMLAFVVHKGPDLGPGTPVGDTDTAAVDKGTAVGPEGVAVHKDYMLGA